MNDVLLITECALEYKGKFLIIKRPEGKHAEGLLSFPGGKFEAIDADPECDVVQKAIKREVYEEVGLELCDPLEYVTTTFFQDEKTHQNVVDIIYHCKLDNTIVDVKPSLEEVPEYYWLTIEETLAKDNCPPWLAKFLRNIQEQN